MFNVTGFMSQLLLGAVLALVLKVYELETAMAM